MSEILSSNEVQKEIPETFLETALDEVKLIKDKEQKKIAMDVIDTISQVDTSVGITFEQRKNILSQIDSLRIYYKENPNASGFKGFLSFVDTLMNTSDFKGKEK